MKTQMMIAGAVALSLAAGASLAAQEGGGNFTRGSKGPHLRKLPDKVLADPPRTPDGQPDFQGEWTPTGRNGNPYHSIEEGSDPGSVVIQGMSAASVSGSFANVIIEPADGTIPYQPWAVAKKKENLQNYFVPTKREHIPPDIRCIEGLPHQNYVIGSFQILQRPGAIVFLYGGDNFRVVPLDGRPHVGENVKMYMGDSRGRWEGNTLVIDVTNNNDKIYYDSHGTIRSDAAHYVERWTMVSDGTIYYEVTADDPKAFTRPMKIAITFDRVGARNKHIEMWEEGCWEGERGAEHMIELGVADQAKGVTGIHVHDKALRDLWIQKAIAEGSRQGVQAKESLCIRPDTCPADAPDTKQAPSKKD